MTAPTSYGYIRRDAAPPSSGDPPSRVAAPRRLEARSIQAGAQRALSAINADGTLVNPPAVGAGSVTLASFAASITPVEIVSVLPAAGSQGRVVFLTTDNKLYRDTGTAWTSLVAADDINGQITSTQITDAAITTPKLAANSVTASALAADSVVAGKIAAGAVSADEISVSELSAIAADVGTLDAGLIQDSGATRGIRLGTATLPAGWDTFLDLDPASDADYIARFANDRFLLTRGGALTLRGSVSVASTATLDVAGDASFDGRVNSRGGAQFATPGAAFNQVGARRVSLDESGSLVLRVQSDGATEGVKAVLGDYTVATAPTTNETQSVWSPTSAGVTTTSRLAWVAAASGPGITLTVANLPSYDGNVRVQGKLTVSVSGGHGAVFGLPPTGVLGRVRCLVNGADAGIVGNGSFSGISGSATFAFEATVAVGTGTTVVLELIPEVYIDDTVGGASATVTANQSVSGSNVVSWKKASGSTLARRGVFLGAEDSQPHLSFEPNPTPPTSTTAAEGEWWYDGAAHAFKYFNGTAVKTVTAS